MIKTKKSVRTNIIIECSFCRLKNQKKGVSRYITSKNKKSNQKKLSLNKYCKYCIKRTKHVEIK